MPIDQLGVDAAILFCDILVPLEPMGTTLRFDSKGPHVEPAVRSTDDIDRLRTDGVADDVGYVYEAVETIVRALDGRVPLLGFAGSPWTLATYLVEGGTSKNHHHLRELLYGEPDALHRLLAKLATVLVDYLRGQIEAGCDVVQIFDSWGGTLSAPQWRRFSGAYTARVMEGIADLGVPIIHYVNGGAHLLEATAELPCDVLSVDWRMSLGEVRQRTEGRYALQGNLDPGVLRAPHDIIAAETRQMMAEMSGELGYIANLGHGITPDVTVDAARVMVETIQAFEGT